MINETTMIVGVCIEGELFMKILFMADMSVKYIDTNKTQSELNEIFLDAKKEIKKADFSILNLENVFGNKKDYKPIIKDGPNLISNDDSVEFVKAISPSIVGMANNHAGDYGEKALIHTIKMLSAESIAVIGAGENSDKAYQPVRIEKDGLKVSILAVCENEFGIATERAGGAAGFDLSKVYRYIKETTNHGEIPIIFFHGGNEENPFPSPEKVKLYRLFVDMGAKAVIAMHTHCPQGFEYYNGSFIAYSMGNFYFPHNNVKKSWNYGYMCDLDVSATEIEAEIIPYRFVEEKLSVLLGEELKFFNEYITELNKPIKDEATLKKLFDAWCVKRGKNAYLNNVSYQGDEQDTPFGIRGLKNVFSCEAHNELIKNTLKIIYEERLEEAKEYLPIIDAFQDMRIYKTINK